MPKKVSLSLGLLMFLFGLKVTVGCINLYFHNVAYIGNDAHKYYTDSMAMLSDFPSRPSFYIQDWLFNWGEIHSHLNFLSKNDAAYWTDLGRLFHTRYMLVCTILSFGNEYVTIIFYNVFFFIGALGLFKTFTYFRPDQKGLFVLLIFFVPSIVFWCSGTSKDGFLLSLIGMVSWSLLRVYAHSNWKNILLLLATLFLLLVLRYFYFIIFIPFFLLAVLSRNKKRPAVYFIVLSVLGTLVFFFSPMLSPKLNFMRLVVNRQQDFFNAIGYSDMRTPTLDDQPMSFVRNLPTALSHVFIEPLSMLGKKIKYDIAAFDSLLVLLLLALACWRLKKRYFKNSYFFLLLFYAGFCLLFIGFTVPNLGAIVRYESPFMCILLLSLFAMGDFKLKKLPLE